MLIAALLVASDAQARAFDPNPVTPNIASQGPVNGAPDAPQQPPRHAKGDPFEKLNRSLYNGSIKFDRGFFRPIAFGYKSVVPKPVRTGLRHILSNLTEPIVFLNDLLQLRPKHALRTFARFALNSTVGIAGLIDVAKAEKLPHRGNGFGNTLARYGVGPGPYLFLPIIGPTTLRDALGSQADALVYPLAIGRPFNQLRYQIPTFVISGLDRRVESDSELNALLDGAADPYATLRSVYLQNRAAEIAEIKGKSVMLDDPLIDPEAPPPDDAAAPTAEGDATPPTDAGVPADPAPTDQAPAEAVPSDPPAPADPSPADPQIVSFFTP